MNLIFTDYLVLEAVGRGNKSAERISAYLAQNGFTLLKNHFSGAVRRLSSAGLVWFTERQIMLTEFGKDFLSNNKKHLFESKSKYEIRAEDTLCTLECGKTAEFEADKETFEFLPDDDYTGSYVGLSKIGEGVKLKLGYSHGDNEPADEEPAEPGESTPGSEYIAMLEAAEDEAERVTAYTSEGRDFVRSFASAVYDSVATYCPMRKICIECEKKSYVLSIAKSQDGLRVTVSEIRSNRKRFSGKQDGELDYAQCGDTVNDFTVSAYMLAKDTANALAALYADMQNGDEFPLETLTRLRKISR